MRHVAAYLMLALSGNESPSASDVKTLLGSVGIEAAQEQLEKLISEVEGKDLAELIAAGSAKLSSVPSGAAGGASAGASAAAGGGAAAEAAPAEESESESASSEGGGMGLFGDEDEDSD